MTPEQKDAWRSVSRVVRWVLCPLALPVGLYLAWELTALILFGGHYSGTSQMGPSPDEERILLSPVFGASAAALSVVLAMLVAPSEGFRVARIMFEVGAVIAVFVFLFASILYGLMMVPVLLSTYAAGAAAGIGLPWYLARLQTRNVGAESGAAPADFPRWVKWVAAFSSALVAAGMIYAACLLVIFDRMWFYREDLAFLRHGHPEAITGALMAAAWVACGSLAAPTLRVWVPFVFLGAAAVPIAWILSVVGPYSHWGPPVLEFIVGVSSAGIVTAGAVSGLLLLRLRRMRSPGV
jgi:hypothetical protein